ncbi:MAG: hypothetical protein M3374_00805 [Pseudomonadota bacterium]|nr:hypothetical protein [Pseudomonadota bacterium]
MARSKYAYSISMIVLLITAMAVMTTADAKGAEGATMSVGMTIVATDDVNAQEVNSPLTQSMRSHIPVDPAFAIRKGQDALRNARVERIRTPGGNVQVVTY